MWKDNSPSKCDAWFGGTVVGYLDDRSGASGLSFYGGTYHTRFNIPLTSEFFTLERTAGDAHAVGSVAILSATIDGVQDTDLIKDEISGPLRWVQAGNVINQIAIPNPPTSCCALVTSPDEGGTIYTYMNGDLTGKVSNARQAIYPDMYMRGYATTRVYGVRVYNRPLTLDEHTHNWRVDKVRYRSTIFHP